jgi:hypothetical protein
MAVNLIARYFFAFIFVDALFGTQIAFTYERTGVNSPFGLNEVVVAEFFEKSHWVFRMTEFIPVLEWE